ncbi:hypothetical protein CCH79_00004313 [Gambusia affinis]|uniref:Uncharacterized protein n=1 Tax=Gambusia affinis TaxID=33528 RepID=A0A315V4D7_GAMAF|nr:hypothetical protein CCH79_00004313 [Gambusia affinis]
MQHAGAQLPACSELHHVAITHVMRTRLEAFCIPLSIAHSSSPLALSPWRENRRRSTKHDSPERPTRKLRTPCPKYLILQEQKIAGPKESSNNIIYQWDFQGGQALGADFQPLHTEGDLQRKRGAIRPSKEADPPNTATLRRLQSVTVKSGSRKGLCELNTHSGPMIGLLNTHAHAHTHTPMHIISWPPPNVGSITPSHIPPITLPASGWCLPLPVRWWFSVSGSGCSGIGQLSPGSPQVVPAVIFHGALVLWGPFGVSSYDTGEKQSIEDIHFFFQKKEFPWLTIAERSQPACLDLWPFAEMDVFGNCPREDELSLSTLPWQAACAVTEEDSSKLGPCLQLCGEENRQTNERNKLQQKALQQPKQKKSKSAEFLMESEERAAVVGIENPAFNGEGSAALSNSPSWLGRKMRGDRPDSTLAAHQKKLELQAPASERGNERVRNYFDPPPPEQTDPRQCETAGVSAEDELELKILTADENRLYERMTALLNEDETFINIPGTLQASRDEEVLEVKAGDLVLQRRLLLHSGGGGGDASGPRPSQAHTIAKPQAESSAWLGGEAGLQAGRMVAGRESAVKTRAAEEVIPCYAQQLRERVRPDMITLGSLSLQQQPDQKGTQEQSEWAKRKKRLMAFFTGNVEESSSQRDSDEMLRPQPRVNTFKNLDSLSIRALGEGREEGAPKELPQSSSSASRPSWQGDQGDLPQSIEVSVCCLRAARDKLPRGLYSVRVALQSSLRGSSLHLRSLKEQTWSASTEPVEHRGRFYDNELHINQSVFMSLPATSEINPSMVLLFQLISLPGHSSHFSSVLAWGVFPVCSMSLSLVQGRFKTPLIRGEPSPQLDQFKKIEAIISSDLDHWLCNLYFQVKKIPLGTSGVTELFVAPSRSLSNPKILSKPEDHHDLTLTQRPTSQSQICPHPLLLQSQQHLRVGPGCRAGDSTVGLSQHGSPLHLSADSACSSASLPGKNDSPEVFSGSAVEKTDPCREKAEVGFQYKVPLYFSAFKASFDLLDKPEQLKFCEISNASQASFLPFFFFFIFFFFFSKTFLNLLLPPIYQRLLRRPLISNVPINKRVCLYEVFISLRPFFFLLSLFRTTLPPIFKNLASSVKRRVGLVVNRKEKFWNSIGVTLQKFSGIRVPCSMHRYAHKVRQINTARLLWCAQRQGSSISTVTLVGEVDKDNVKTILVTSKAPLLPSAVSFAERAETPALVCTSSYMCICVKPWPLATSAWVHILALGQLRSLRHTHTYKVYMLFPLWKRHPVNPNFISPSLPLIFSNFLSPSFLYFSGDKVLQL